MILEKEQIQRYLRHILIPEISGAGQKKLLDSTVMLRCNDLSKVEFLLYYLTAMGVGTIHCFADQAEAQEKITAQLFRLNPDVKLVCHDATSLGKPDFDIEYQAAIVYADSNSVNIDARNNIPTVVCASAGSWGYLKANIENCTAALEEAKAFASSGRQESLYGSSCTNLLGVLASIEVVKLLINLGKPCLSGLIFDLYNYQFTYGNSVVPKHKDDAYRQAQEKLKNAKVLIIGSGGLGSPVAFNLAAIGIGKLGLVDYDRVEISNLNRQILHTTDKIGMPKVKSAEEFLKRMNPELELCVYEEKFTAANAEQLLEEYDFVIDGLDNLPSRYLLNDVCYFMKKPLVESGVLGFNGLAAGIVPDVGPCYRCIFPESTDKKPLPS